MGNVNKSRANLQILAKRGTDSRFVLKVNLKILRPMSSRSSILKTQNRVHTKHEYKPCSNSHDNYCSYTSKSAKHEAQIVKAEFVSSESDITRVEL